MKKRHQAPLKYQCKECGFISDFVADLWEHAHIHYQGSSRQFTQKQTENITLKIVAEQSVGIMEEVETLKKDMKAAFVHFVEIMKEDMDGKCKTLGNSVIKLYKKIAKLESTTKATMDIISKVRDNQSTTKPTPKVKVKTKPTPSVPSKPNT